MKIKGSTRVFISLVVIGILISLMIGIGVYNFGEYSKAKKSHCAIILGCSVYGETPSPFLQWRTEEGYRLFKEGYVDYIIASGGKGPGENISEARAIEKYLLNKGVDRKYIIIEDKSTTTMENLKNCKAIMKEKGFENAVVISNKFHLKRASLMTKKIGIDASFSGVYVTSYKDNEIFGFLREIPALIKFYIMGC